MLIFVKIIKIFFFIIYDNLCKYHGRTDRQTHQMYSSEPHKIYFGKIINQIKLFWG